MYRDGEMCVVLWRCALLLGVWSPRKKMLLLPYKKVSEAILKDY